jgi:hypothetical protein
MIIQVLHRYKVATNEKWKAFYRHRGMITHFIASTLLENSKALQSVCLSATKDALAPQPERSSS